MWPFKKKFPPLESLPVEDEWAVGQSECDGKPIMVCANTSAFRYARHPELSFRLRVAILLNDPTENGLPTVEENRVVNEIEARLLAFLGSDGRMVIRIMTDGKKEFFSYVRSAEIAERAVAQLRAATKTHELNYDVKPDPAWKAYNDFAK